MPALSTELRGAFRGFPSGFSCEVVVNAVKVGWFIHLLLPKLVAEEGFFSVRWGFDDAVSRVLSFRV